MKPPRNPFAIPPIRPDWHRALAEKTAFWASVVAGGHGPQV